MSDQFKQRYRATLLIKKLRQRCFPVNFEEFLKALFYKTPLGDCFCMQRSSLNKKISKIHYNFSMQKHLFTFSRFSSKYVFIKISQISQESTCVGVSFLIELQACEIFKTFKQTFFYRTPLVATSVYIEIVIIEIEIFERIRFYQRKMNQNKKNILHFKICVLNV